MPAVDGKQRQSRFRLVQALGQGGMGSVQLVLQTTPAGVERLAVMKRPRPELARHPEFAGMFWEETRIAITLGHPNIVQTYEAGQDDAGYFLLLEFLRGQSYAEWIDHSGYPDFRASLEVLLGTLQALEYAHRSRDPSGREMAIVHRDISPPNVFVTYEGQVKVLDFGIAKARDSTVHTQEGVIKGKIAYMPPEQMLGRAMDLRADLYAVGVMLWEAVAGRQRFAGMRDVEIASVVKGGQAPLVPAAATRGLPALADEICRRALAYSPAERYASAAVFHDDLVRLAEQCGGRVPQRLLGQTLAERFTLQRQAQQARIEAELCGVPARASEAATNDPKPGGTRVVHKRALVPVPPLALVANDEAAPNQPPRSRRPLIVLGLGLLVVAGGGLKLGASLSKREQTTSTSSRSSAPPAVGSTPLVVIPGPLASAAASVSASPPTPRPRKLAPLRAKPKPALAKEPPDEFGGRR